MSASGRLIRAYDAGRIADGFITTSGKAASLYSDTLLPALAVYGAVMGVIAAVAAGNRQPYRYPLTFRFVS